MVLMENIHIFNCRSERISAFKISGQNNKFLIFSIFIKCLIKIIVIIIKNSKIMEGFQIKKSPFPGSPSTPVLNQMPQQA